MPVFMQSGGGKPTVFFERFELTGFYLWRAYQVAKRVLDHHNPSEDQDRLENYILTVIWGSLALEAGANSLAEDIISPTELKNFDKCRKKYQKPPSVSSTTWKWHILFKDGPKKDLQPSSPILVEIEKLITLRHRLVHYSAQETARKFYYAPPKPGRGPDGKMKMAAIWSCDMEPEKVEPSLIENTLLGISPATHYMAARNVFLEWELANGRDGSHLADIPAL